MKRLKIVKFVLKKSKNLKWLGEGGGEEEGDL
jgi:hypothetical protein